MDIKKFNTVLDKNSDTLLKDLDTISISHLTFKTEDKWSALEILEHIAITDRIIIMIISKPTENIHGSASIYGGDRLKELLVDKRDSKVLSPDSLKPKGVFNDVSTFKTTFLEQRNKLKEALVSNTIPVDSRIHKHPFLGEMTISDWLNFIIHHTERHRIQMEETLKMAFENASNPQNS